MALAHRCPDGTNGRLKRTGPVGSDGPEVLFTCPRCDYRKDAATLKVEHERAFALIRSAIADGSFR